MHWFTSDLHLDHENIIKYMKRPYNNKDEMNEDIIKKWNSRVSNSDTVWCLGDLLWTKERSEEKAKLRTHELLCSLSGNIVLIKGDHDYCSINYYSTRFLAIHDFYIFRVNERLDMPLFHWPIARWPKSHYNSWHLYGHNHGMFQNQGKSFDVGVDCNNFMPLSLDEIAEKMKLRPDNENIIREKKPEKGVLEQLSMKFKY